MNWTLQTIKSNNITSVYYLPVLFFKEQFIKIIKSLCQDDLPQEHLKHYHDYNAKKLQHFQIVPPFVLLIFKYSTFFNRATHTAISRSGGYEVYRLASDMPKSKKKKRKPLQAKFLSLFLSNQNEI